MGRGGQQQQLAEAQALMLHNRLDEACAAALTALGAPRVSSASSWEDVIDELPSAAAGAKKPSASVVQLSCIAVQCAFRADKAESAASLVGALYAPAGAETGAVKAASAAPVEVVLSLAHGLAAAGKADEAKAAVRGRLAAFGDVDDSPAGSPAKSPSKSAARSDGALLTEYLLFHLLCPATPAGGAAPDPAKRAKAVEAARKALKGGPKLPKPVKDAFTTRLDALAEEAEATAKAAKEQARQKKRDAAAPAPAPAMPPRAPSAAVSSGTPASPGRRKKERSIGREVAPAVAPPQASFAVRLTRLIFTVKGIGSIGVISVLGYFLSKSAIGRWLYMQIEGMLTLATSVRM